MIESDHQIAAFSVTIYSRTIHRDDVELAIVIAIDEAHSAAGRFDNVMLLRFGNVRNRETGLPGDIFKAWGWRCLAHTTQPQQQNQWQDPHKAF